VHHKRYKDNKANTVVAKKVIPLPSRPVNKLFRNGCIGNPLESFITMKSNLWFKKISINIIIDIYYNK
jgi:hypothetical protein